MTLSQHDIEMLTVKERLELIERVWDSLAMTQDDIPLTNSQRAELDRRIDELEERGPVGIPWEQVLDRIKSKGMRRVEFSLLPRGTSRKRSNCTKGNNQAS